MVGVLTFRGAAGSHWPDRVPTPTLPGWSLDVPPSSPWFWIWGRRGTRGCLETRLLTPSIFFFFLAFRRGLRPRSPCLVSLLSTHKGGSAVNGFLSVAPSQGKFFIIPHFSPLFFFFDLLICPNQALSSFFFFLFHPFESLTRNTRARKSTAPMTVMKAFVVVAVALAVVSLIPSANADFYIQHPRYGFVGFVFSSPW